MGEAKSGIAGVERQEDDRFIAAEPVEEEIPGQVWVRWLAVKLPVGIE